MENLNPALMTFKQFIEYLGIKERMGRKLVNSPDCNYVVRIGSRIYVHKEILDNELKRRAKLNIPLKPLKEDKA